MNSGADSRRNRSAPGDDGKDVAAFGMVSAAARHAVVYAALGQIDRRVPLKPANWVHREEVIHYPTDFSAMLETNIRQLSGRGEAITRALVTQYLLTE